MSGTQESARQAHDRIMREREIEELKAWKASALQVLARWHALGVALQERYPLRLGDDMPTALLVAVKAAKEKQ